MTSLHADPAGMTLIEGHHRGEPHEVLILVVGALPGCGAQEQVGGARSAMTGVLRVWGAETVIGGVRAGQIEGRIVRVSAVARC